MVEQTPSAFTIGSPVRPLLKIHNDGTVEADIADMPEAAKVLAEHVQMHMQQWAENIRAAERARILASLREPDALERLVDAVTEAANIVSYDGYYEIDKEAAVHALDAALSAATDHMETRDAG